MVDDRDQTSLGAVGGEVGLWVRATSASDEDLPSLIAVIASSWEQLSDHQRAEELILGHISRTPSPNALGESVEAVLSSSAAAEAIGARVAAALVERARDRSSAGAADLAARALEGAMRVVLSGGADSQRLPVLAELVRPEAASSRYASRVSRLLAVAYEQWQIPEAKTALESFLDVSGAEGDAAYERGMVALADALAASTADDVLAALHEADGWLDRSSRWEEARTDAVFYRLAIKGVLSFGAGLESQDLKAVAAEMRSLLVEQHLAFLNMRATWTSSRLDAEHEWWRLVDLLGDAQYWLEQPSWIAPLDAAVQVLEAHRASRTLRPASSTSGDEGVGFIVEPRIRSAFLQRQGLRHHLVEALRIGAFSADVATTAKELLSATDEPRSPPDPELQTRYPALHRMLGEGAGTDELRNFAADNSGVLDVIELCLNEADARRRYAANTQIELAHSRLSGWLGASDDYAGVAAIEVDELLNNLLHFLWSRMTSERATLGRRGSYLFPYAAGHPPHEREMAMDLREYLEPNMPFARARAEVRDVGGGRVDVLVSYPQREYVIECKRELLDASSTGLESYLPQVAQYQATASSIAVLLVLDLTAVGVMPAFRQCIWEREVDLDADSESGRRVIVLRLPGNRATPSSLTR